MQTFTCKRCGAVLEMCPGSARVYAGVERYPWKYTCHCMARYQISKGRIDRLVDGPEVPPLPGWGDFPKLPTLTAPPLPLTTPALPLLLPVPPLPRK